jgi:hypothetical protein
MSLAEGRFITVSIATSLPLFAAPAFAAQLIPADVIEKNDRSLQVITP